ESGVLKALGVVDHGIDQVQVAFAVDEYAAAAGAFEDLVALLLGVELDLVLQTRTAAADDLDAKTADRRRRSLCELADPGSRFVGDGDHGCPSEPRAAATGLSR